MRRLILSLASLVVSVGCSEGREASSELAMDLLSRGLFTCVNTSSAVTCFGGQFPKSWDGRSLPVVPVVLHRPNRKARLVGDVLICLDDGQCFGEPAIGSVSIANRILAPIDWSAWSQIESALNVVCGLDLAGEVTCWGQDWLQQPTGTFQRISLGDLQICGSNPEGLNCQRLRHYPEKVENIFVQSQRVESEEDQTDLYGAFQGFTNSCSGFAMTCAQDSSRNGVVRCWYQQGNHTDYSGVKEFACSGSHVCINTGERVECHAREEASKVFDLKISNLSMGTYHFCGIDQNSLLTCRVFGDMSIFERPPLMEPLSYEAWQVITPTESR